MAALEVTWIEPLLEVSLQAHGIACRIEERTASGICVHRCVLVSDPLISSLVFRLLLFVDDTNLGFLPLSHDCDLSVQLGIFVLDVQLLARDHIFHFLVFDLQFESLQSELLLLVGFGEDI